MAQYLMPHGAHPNAFLRALRHPPLAVCVGLAAFLAILPLILHGCSCGHDQVFHIQGWLDAAQQLRHGIYPRWSSTSAWNAGEPRFIFYPPLSWLLGAALTLIFPIAATPTIYIFIALLASGLTFYKLTSHFVSTNAALLASALYLANPYMLFNAFERSALAELLAAAWIPLLLLAILRPRPTIRGIAIPIALLWLTNAPAAVMGCYTLALLAILRLILSLTSTKICHSEPTLNGVKGKSKDPEDLDLPTPPNPFPPTPPSPLRLTLTCLAGTLLGLALPAFYLLPAAYERRYVQIAMAIIPGMRYQDNFLFTHTADAAHNTVNHTATLLALTLIALTFAALIALWIKARKTSPPQTSVISTEARSAQRRDLQFPLLLALTLLAAIITFMLFPPSTFLWLHVPELAFLQLPWRLLTILSAVLALALALLLNTLFPTPTDAGAPFMRSHRMSGPATIFAAILPLALGFYAFHLYAQFCNPNDLPTNIAQHLATHHGFAPTDEYTPTHADNDILRTDNPAYWLIPQGADPNTPAPNTTPTATELNPAIDTDDNPIPLTQTISTPALQHLTLHLTQPQTLILNLRDYPALLITNQRTPDLPPHIQRDDGLVAIPVAAGNPIIDITWYLTPDQILGRAISGLALIALALTFCRTKT
jgi:hypothetical protein